MQVLHDFSGKTIILMVDFPASHVSLPEAINKKMHKSINTYNVGPPR
jgi:hypothetical protein